MSSRVERAAQVLAGGRVDEVRAALQELDHEAPTPELIELLCGALGSDRWGIRKLAAARLMKIGESAVPNLIELLRSSNNDQIYWACQVLALVEPPPARQLQAVLKRPDATHRRFAVHAFERRTAEDAVEALITALDDPAWELRQRAADALHARLTQDELMDLVRSERMRATRNRVYWSVLLLCRRLGAQVIPTVMKLLPWEDDDLRHLVISTLAGLKVEGVGGLLSRYVADRSPVIRREVFDQLVHLGEPAVGAVEEALEAASDAPSRLIFLRVLAKVKASAYEARLRELLSSRRVEDRYLAIDAVGAAPSRRAVAIGIVAFKDTLQVVRRHASEVLCTLGDAAVPALEAAADGRDHDAKFWAVQTLGRMGTPGLAAMRRLLRHEDQETRSLVLQAFTNIELPDDFLPALLPLLSDAHWPFRKQAAEALHARGPAAARVLLSSALGTEGDERFWARKVLADLFGPAATHWMDALEEMEPSRMARVLEHLRAAPTETVQSWLGCAPEAVLPELEAAVGTGAVEEDSVAAVAEETARAVEMAQAAEAALATEVARIAQARKLPAGPAKPGSKFAALGSLVRRGKPEAVPARPAPAVFDSGIAGLSLDALAGGVEMVLPPPRGGSLLPALPAPVEPPVRAAGQPAAAGHAPAAAGQAPAAAGQAPAAAGQAPVASPPPAAAQPPAPVVPPVEAVERVPAKLTRPNLAPSQPVPRPGAGADPTPGPVAPRTGAAPGRPPAPAPARRVLQPDWGGRGGPVETPMHGSLSPSHGGQSGSHAGAGTAAAGLAAMPAQAQVPAPAVSPASAIVVPPSRAEVLDQLAQLVRHLEEAGGNEMHLKVGAAPVVRVVDRMVQLGGAAQTAEFLTAVAETIGAQGSTVAQVCVDLEGAGRCRIRVAREARGPSLMIRPLGSRPPTLDLIGREPQLDQLKTAASGLILISGGAASGRTWTASALLNAINAVRPAPITSVEAPVEHVNYPNPGFLSLVSVPADFPTHRAALDYALACGAAVISLSDIADREVAALALEASASGTLVIGIMRSTGALDALEQLVALAGMERSRTLSLLATSLRASIYQVLLPHATDRRLVPAREFVMGSAEVTRDIMHGRFNEVRDRMAARSSADARSLADSIADLERKGVIAR